MGQNMVQLFILSILKELSVSVNSKKKTPLIAGLEVTSYVAWRIQEQSQVSVLRQFYSSKCLGRIRPYCQYDGRNTHAVQQCQKLGLQGQPK